MYFLKLFLLSFLFTKSINTKEQFVDNYLHSDTFVCFLFRKLNFNNPSQMIIFCVFLLMRREQIRIMNVGRGAWSVQCVELMVYRNACCECLFINYWLKVKLSGRILKRPCRIVLLTWPIQLFLYSFLRFLTNSYRFFHILILIMQ